MTPARERQPPGSGRLLSENLQYDGPSPAS